MTVLPSPIGAGSGVSVVHPAAEDDDAGAVVVDGVIGSHLSAAGTFVVLLVFGVDQSLVPRA